MRELKFRAYHGEPGTSTMKYNVGVHPFMLFRLSAFDIDNEYDDNNGDLIVSPGAYHVMQYTGINDKNGKDIYEGDIVHFVTYDGGGFGKVGIDAYYEIVFAEHNTRNDVLTDYMGWWAKDKSGTLHSISYLTNSHKAIVIGNIHENSDILNETK